MTWEDLRGIQRYITFIFFIIAAVLFHKTAIIAVILPFFAKRRYTSNTTWIIVAITLGVTLTNLVSSIISLLELGTGYVTTEVGNAVNVGVMSFLYFALLLLRTFTRSRNDIVLKKGYEQQGCNMVNIIYGDDFYTYCIALSLAVTVMSLRAAGLSRFNMYLQLIGVPYISNVMSKIKKQRDTFIIKIVFSVAVWLYSVVALIYRPEWQHIWPYHFYWQ